MQADSSTTRDAKQITRLFYHECLRVFHDRLIDKIDKNYFYRLLSSTCLRSFGDEVIRLPPQSEEITDPPMLFFGDFMSFGASKESRYYEEIINVGRMKEVLQVCH